MGFTTPVQCNTREQCSVILLCSRAQEPGPGGFPGPTTQVSSGSLQGSGMSGSNTTFLLPRLIVRTPELGLGLTVRTSELDPVLIIKTPDLGPGLIVRTLDLVPHKLPGLRPWRGWRTKATLFRDWVRPQ